MRLLEEDEDETMHSGADVEAFQAALNRDIGGDVYSSQPSDSVAVPVNNFQIGQLQGKNDNANNTEELNAQNVEKQHHHQEQHSSVMETKQNGPNAENQQQLGVSPQEPTHPPLIKKTSQDDIKQEPVEQKMSNQQTAGTDQVGSQKNSRQIPFAILLPALKPYLDKDREMQLQTLYNKLRKNEIAKDQFVRLMRNIVGDQVLRLAAARLQSQASTNQSQSQPQAGRQHNVPMPAVQLQTDSSIANSQKSKAVEWKPDSPVMQASQSHSSNASIANQERERSLISPQGQNKQQHVHFPPASFPMYGSSGSNYHPYSGTNVSTSGPSVKPQPLDPQTRQISHHQNMGVTQTGGPMHNMISTPKFERLNSADDPGRVQSGSVSQYTNKSALQQNSAPWQAPPNREKSPAPFSSLKYVKPGLLEQAGEQQNKPQLLSPQVLSPSTVEQGNAISVNLKDQSLDKQSSKIVFSTMPPNSFPPSIATQMDPNDQVLSY
ncbi:hypothetical protein OIU76_006337 [Salix suchowensis]|nr:hypothetical protein OIU76_006337 [Salix suchowensis]